MATRVYRYGGICGGAGRHSEFGLCVLWDRSWMFLRSVLRVEKKTAPLEIRGFSTVPSCVRDACGSALGRLASPDSCFEASANYQEREDFSPPRRRAACWVPASLCGWGCRWTSTWRCSGGLCLVELTARVEGGEEIPHLVLKGFGGFCRDCLFLLSGA